jgi:hypothetical protein
MLLTRVAPTYLRAAVSAGGPRHDALVAAPLWWPPIEIAGPDLGPYLAQAVSDAKGTYLEHHYVIRTAPSEPAGTGGRASWH